MSMSRFASIGLLCLLSGACTVVIKPAEEREPAPENTEPEPTRRPTPQPKPVPRTTEPERPPPPPPPARPTPSPTRRGVPRLSVPRGHLPSSGLCRVWIENMAPGRQARQESCPGILAAAPAGAWVLYRPAHTPQHMRVRYVNQRHAGQIVAVRVYDAQSGQYLQELALADDDDNMAPIVAQRTPVQRAPETGRPVTPPGREGVRNGGGSSGGTDTTNVGRRNGNGNGSGNGNGNGNGRGNSGQADTAQADTTATTTGNGNNNGRRGNGNANGNSGNGNNGSGDANAGNGNNGNNGNGRRAPQTRGNDQEGPGSRGGGADTPLEAGGQLPLSVDVRYFPRTGQCRVWMPARATGQQAQPRSCNGITREAPAGAWILRRMRNEPGVIYVDYVDERRGGTVVKTSVFDSTTRAFLR